jgi:hypothetical protein
MSEKSDLFFKSIASKGPVEGASDAMPPAGPSEPDGDEGGGDLSDAEKLAAYEMLEAMNGSPGSAQTRAVAFGKALKSFLSISGSEPEPEAAPPGQDPY